ncbi:MAG: DUF4034 domain-containing protein [Hyphomicrobium sp.]|uniref:DUF4034 domain-containing protein n=1 Tax=Hyphomicrobium sp. TaxID=82 RepID=UPI003D1065EB
MSPIRRTALLFLAPIAFVFALAPANASDAPAWLELLAQRDYDRIEDGLNQLRLEPDADGCASCAAMAPYYAFANSDPVIGQRLDDWVAARPDSVPARLARGLYLDHLSWLARGDASAHETHARQWEAMYRLQEAAIGDLSWAIAHDRALSPAYVALMKIRAAQGNEGAVAELYGQGLDANPDSPDLYEARIWSLSPWWQSRLPWRQAIERQLAFVAELTQRRAGQAGFEWLEGYADFLKAEFFARDEYFVGAIAAYGSALQARERTAYLLERAAAYRSTGQYALARADIERAFAINPASKPVLYKMADLRADDCRKARREEIDSDRICEEATSLLDKVVARDPLNPDYLLRRATHLSESGRFEDARRDAESAEIYGQFDCSVQARIGRIYEDFDPPAAKLAYQSAITLSPTDPVHFDQYLGFLRRTEDCEYLDLLEPYRAVCEQTGKCRSPVDTRALAREFQSARRRSCAAETWQEPDASLAMPE